MAVVWLMERLPGMHHGTHILISCLFGIHYTKVYPAIRGRECVFFSNNPALRSECEAKGWRFVIVENHEISDDIRISSQQSKYIKFLQFLRDFPQFADAGAITYFDHKFHVTDEHISWLLGAIAADMAILIRTTPRPKTSISDEVKAAMGQQRYVLNMDKTLRWIENMKKTAGIVEHVRIVNTGFIHYADRDAIMPMLDQIYQAVWQLGQPECQILWAALSQPYQARIQRVAWEELNPTWQAPGR